MKCNPLQNEQHFVSSLEKSDGTNELKVPSCVLLLPGEMTE